MQHIRFELGLAAIALTVVAACGGGSPAASTAPASSTAQPVTSGTSVPITTQPPIPTPEPGVEGSAEAVCAAMTDTLVQAALGASADEPQFGDVAGGDGVYCYFQAPGETQNAVEVQFDVMDQQEFNAMAETLGAEDPLVGVGRSAFTRPGAYTGGPGATVLAWNEGQGVTVLIEREGADQAALTEAARAIAESVLAGV